MLLTHHSNVTQCQFLTQVIPPKNTGKSKPLLQVSVSELHNDLIAAGPSCSCDRNPLVSGWKLRMVLLKEAGKMTSLCKIMFACVVCVQMRLCQTSQN